MYFQNFKAEYRSETEHLLKSVFGRDKTLVDSAELVVRLICIRSQDSNEIIGHAAGYVRIMNMAGSSFRAGIIGDVAVAPSYQRRGIASTLISGIHDVFKSRLVEYSFLFAYNTDVYLSSGYVTLDHPIMYWDVNARKWYTFVYNGGMYHSFIDASITTGIDFNGRVY